jgi:hypothetical protein
MTRGRGVVGGGPLTLLLAKQGDDGFRWPFLKCRLQDHWTCVAFFEGLVAGIMGVGWRRLQAVLAWT